MTRDADITAQFQNLSTRLLRQARLLDETSNLTSAQYSAISTLYSNPGLPLTELAAMEYVSHPTMSRIVSNLIGQGMIVRKADTSDRRATRLSLSVAGEAAYRRVYERRLKVIGELLAALKPETIEDLHNVLSNLPSLKA